MIKITKTIYDPIEKDDGTRILVMKIWPRGVTKSKIDLWVKEVGTDKELIKKWKHGKIDWKEFTHEYRKSLKGKKDVLEKIASIAKRGTITLLCGCKDEKHCHRILLKKAIENLIKKKSTYKKAA